MKVAPHHLICNVIDLMSGWLALFLAGASSVLKTRSALALKNVALPVADQRSSTLREEAPAVARSRPPVIRRINRENPGWGAPRIHGELLKLGINLGEASVSKYLLRTRNHRPRHGGLSSRIT